MLKFLIGGKNAQACLYEGTIYSAEAASHLGMIDQVSSTEKLLEDAREAARRLAAKDAAAFRSIKGLLRGPVAEEMVGGRCLCRSLWRSGIPRTPGKISTQCIHS